jgi:hypothetical protein
MSFSVFRASGSSSGDTPRESAEFGEVLAELVSPDVPIFVSPVSMMSPLLHIPECSPDAAEPGQVDEPSPPSLVDRPWHMRIVRHIGDFAGRPREAFVGMHFISMIAATPTVPQRALETCTRLYTLFALSDLSWQMNRAVVRFPRVSCRIY